MAHKVVVLHRGLPYTGLFLISDSKFNNFKSSWLQIVDILNLRNYDRLCSNKLQTYCMCVVSY